MMMMMMMMIKKDHECTRLLQRNQEGHATDELVFPSAMCFGMPQKTRWHNLYLDKLQSCSKGCPSQDSPPCHQRNSPTWLYFSRVAITKSSMRMSSCLRFSGMAEVAVRHVRDHTVGMTKSVSPTPKCPDQVMNDPKTFPRIKIKAPEEK